MDTAIDMYNTLRHMRKRQARAGPPRLPCVPPVPQLPAWPPTCSPCGAAPQMAHQVLNLAMIVCSALMIWKSLMVVTESDSPVVVVLRRAISPAPAARRSD